MSATGAKLNGSTEVVAVVCAVVIIGFTVGLDIKPLVDKLNFPKSS